MNVFLADNAAMLEQGVRLLGTLSDTDYVRRHEQCFNSSIGGHMRHAVEHYICFLDGLADGAVDYDSRKRDADVETRRAAAIDALADLAARVSALELDEAAPLQVRLDTGGASLWTASSVGRELQFLLSHTVHHYALITVLCKLHDLPTEPGFGVAPSTLRALAAGASTY